MTPGLRVSPRAAVLAALFVLTFAIYGQTASYPFITLDDGKLIFDNPHVLRGLTREGVAWALTANEGASFWHPLTWLSFMADISLFGMNAGAFHAVSVSLHFLCSAVLYLALRRMTGSDWRSGAVAALFAVHPLHVESVAWAAERKDTLSGLFFCVGLWAWTRYAEKPGLRRYLAVAAALALSLMSKPMAVTFPCVLLLFDGWPLRRIRGWGAPDQGGRFPAMPLRTILLEKIPFLMMAAGAAAITLTYRRGEAWIGETSAAYPFWVRAANAAESYASYLWKTFWPARLSIFYRHPGLSIDPAVALAALALLAGITAGALRLRKRSPSLPVGWLFFLGTLVPVIGLLQVSDQAMADRFAYIPAIGLFVAIAWGVPDLAERLRLPRAVPAAIAVAAILALAGAAWKQAGYWRSSDALFSHALEIDPDDWMAHTNLGMVRMKAGRIGEAERYFRAALRVRPGTEDALYNLGLILFETGRRVEAAACFMDYLAAHPGDPFVEKMLEESMPGAGNGKGAGGALSR